MNTVKINKTQLINVIAENTAHFGHHDRAIYVNAQGQIDARNGSELNTDWMPVLTLSGMGNFQDSEQNYPDSDKYDSDAVSKYIVDDAECLTLSGVLDGVEYRFEIVDMKYKIVDEHNTVETGIDNLDDAIEYAKKYTADVFEDCENGDCVWVNPKLKVS